MLLQIKYSDFVGTRSTSSLLKYFPVSFGFRCQEKHEDTHQEKQLRAVNGEVEGLNLVRDGVKKSSNQNKKKMTVPSIIIRWRSGNVRDNVKSSPNELQKQ